MGNGLIGGTAASDKPVYTLWLRLFAILVALLAGGIWLGRTLVLTDTNPNLPWNEEFRILKDGQSARYKPSAGQAQISHVLRYRADAQQEGSPAGQVNLIIYPDGAVKGVWNGEFSSPEIHRLIMAASFKGNTDPSKICPGEQKGEQSSLYFISRGTFALFETNKQTGGNRDVNGHIYVRGWLYPDCTIVGEIIITENRKQYEVFSWAAQPSN